MQRSQYYLVPLTVLSKFFSTWRSLVLWYRRPTNNTKTHTSLGAMTISLCWRTHWAKPHSKNFDNNFQSQLQAVLQPSTLLPYFVSKDNPILVSVSDRSPDVWNIIMSHRFQVCVRRKRISIDFYSAQIFEPELLYNILSGYSNAKSTIIISQAFRLSQALLDWEKSLPLSIFSFAKYTISFPI